MTNYEKIKNMSIEELAEYLHGKAPCQFCFYDDCSVADSCISGIKQWLESENE